MVRDNQNPPQPTAKNSFRFALEPLQELNSIYELEVLSLGMFFARLEQFQNDSEIVPPPASPAPGKGSGSLFSLWSPYNYPRSGTPYVDDAYWLKDVELPEVWGVEGFNQSFSIIPVDYSASGGTVLDLWINRYLDGGNNLNIQRWRSVDEGETWVFGESHVQSLTFGFNTDFGGLRRNQLGGGRIWAYLTHIDPLSYSSQSLLLLGSSNFKMAGLNTCYLQPESALDSYHRESRVHIRTTLTTPNLGRRHELKRMIYNPCGPTWEPSTLPHTIPSYWPTEIPSGGDLVHEEYVVDITDTYTANGTYERIENGTSKDVYDNFWQGPYLTSAEAIANPNVVHYKVWNGWRYVDNSVNTITITDVFVEKPRYTVSRDYEEAAKTAFLSADKENPPDCSGSTVPLTPDYLYGNVGANGVVLYDVSSVSSMKVVTAWTSVSKTRCSSSFIYYGLGDDVNTWFPQPYIGWIIAIDPIPYNTQGDMWGMVESKTDNVPTYRWCTINEGVVSNIRDIPSGWGYPVIRNCWPMEGLGLFVQCIGPGGHGMYFSATGEIDDLELIHSLPSGSTDYQVVDYAAFAYTIQSAGNYIPDSEPKIFSGVTIPANGWDQKTLYIPTDTEQIISIDDIVWTPPTAPGGYSGPALEYVFVSAVWEMNQIILTVAFPVPDTYYSWGNGPGWDGTNYIFNVEATMAEGYHTELMEVAFETDGAGGVQTKSSGRVAYIHSSGMLFGTYNDYSKSYKAPLFFAKKFKGGYGRTFGVTDLYP